MDHFPDFWAREGKLHHVPAKVVGDDDEHEEGKHAVSEEFILVYLGRGKHLLV